MRTKSRIHQLREARGTTLRELARQAGMPFTTLDTWARRGLPESVAQAVRLASALGVCVEGLLADGGAL